MNRAMTILLTHARMIIIRNMVKHAVSVLASSHIEKMRQVSDTFNKILYI